MAFPFNVPAYRGEWSSTTASTQMPTDLRYITNNIVTFTANNRTDAYICLTDNTTEQPSATATDWRIYSSAGNVTPNPGPRESFTSTLNPMSVRTDATGRTFTLTLGVSGDGFTYTGYQNLVTPTGLTTTAPAMAAVTDGMDSVLTFTLPQTLAVTTFTITGQILSTDGNSNNVDPHPFSVTFRVTAVPAPGRDVFYGYATSATTGTAARGATTVSYTDLAETMDTNVVAAAGAEFRVAGTTSTTVQDLVILVPTGFGLEFINAELLPDETITTINNLPDGLTGYQGLRLFNYAGSASYRLTEV